MSYDAIILEIRRESEERAAAIRKEAEAEGQEILKKAQKEAETEYAALMNEGLGEIREEERRLISLANLEANELLRRTKEEGIADCFLETEKRLSEVPSSENYPAILLWLIEEGKEAIGEDELTALTRREDRDLVKDLISGADGISPGQEEIRDAGVVILSEKLNVRIDQTFPERLKRLNKRLRHDTAVMLYGRI